MSMRDDSRSVTVTITDEAIGRFRDHRTFRTEGERAAADGMDTTELAGLKEELEARFRALTEWVQTSPDADLVALAREG